MLFKFFSVNETLFIGANLWAADEQALAALDSGDIVCRLKQ